MSRFAGGAGETPPSAPPPAMDADRCRACSKGPSDLSKCTCRARHPPQSAVWTVDAEPQFTVMVAAQQGPRRRTPTRSNGSEWFHGYVTRGARGESPTDADVPNGKHRTRSDARLETTACSAARTAPTAWRAGRQTSMWAVWQ